jgi:hypothetical protein
MLQSLYNWFNNLIHRPAQVFWICATLAGVGVVLDGTAFRLWSLHRDHRVFTHRLKEGGIRSRQLDYRIQRAAQPAFIEKAVRDQFDLVKKGDLIFIFSDDAP